MSEHEKSDDREKEWLRYGIQLGLVAGITPESVDLSDERIERIYRLRKEAKKQGIAI